MYTNVYVWQSSLKQCNDWCASSVWTLRCSRCRTSVIPRLHKDMKYWKWDFVFLSPRGKKCMTGKLPWKDCIINTAISLSKKNLIPSQNCIIRQTDCRLHIYTNRDHKTSPPESFVLRAKCSQGKRFIWLHYVCMVRLVQPSFLLDTFLAH